MANGRLHGWPPCLPGLRGGRLRRQPGLCSQGRWQRNTHSAEGHDMPLAA